jgi:hypothetical protein
MLGRRDPNNRRRTGVPEFYFIDEVAIVTSFSESGSCFINDMQQDTVRCNENLLGSSTELLVPGAKLSPIT